MNRLIKLTTFLLLIPCLLTASVSSAMVDPTASKVYSCTIKFPLNSVQFSPQRIEDCFKDVSPELISYIHVVATATPLGTNEHNLYLSTRRAGAIEGFLRNRYPDAQIHAFGGGENPKFGKLARIFVVEGAADQEGDRVVAIPQAPVIETRYIEVKKHGLRITPQLGSAHYVSQSEYYQIHGVQVSVLPENILLPYQLPLHFGLGYRILRSNHSLDIHEWLAVVDYLPFYWEPAPRWQLTGGGRLSGQLYQARDSNGGVGAHALVGLKHDVYHGELALGRTSRFWQMTLGLHVTL